MFIFDIDGVITEPVTGKVSEKVIEVIVEMLEKGEPVAFNTGRGLQWVLRDILPTVECRISSRSILNKLCIVYEKGAFLIGFNDNGQLEEPLIAPGIISIPDNLRTDIQELVASKYAATMFPGEEKRAICSPQMLPETNFTSYKVAQKQLVTDLQHILQYHGLEVGFRVDPTRIATDVEDVHLGKALGSLRVLEWLGQRHIYPNSFITLGDSKSDADMAEALHGQGFSIEFVFVGGVEQLEGLSFPFPVTYTHAFCEKGTIEYLTHWQQNTGI